MSTTALTAQPRSLDLPLGAKFCPEELIIGPSTSQAEYQKLGAGLRKLDTASELWTADFSLFGVRTWGKEQGLQLAHEATGLSKFFLYKTSFVAARFSPERRLPGYKYSAYRELLPFPPEWAYDFLARHAGEKLPAKALRALAVSEFGSEPYKAKQPKKQKVSIRCELYARLRPFSESRKVCLLVERILEDWLKQRPEAQKEPVGSAEAEGNESAATQPCPNQEAPRPVEVDLSEPETQTGRGGPKEYLDAEDGIHRLTDRPTYQQRREAQLANGAQRVSKRVGKRMQKPPKRELHLQWVPCVKASKGADRFPTLEDAQAAEEKYFREKGYHNEIVYCVVPCGAYHVKHAFSGEPQNKSAQAAA